MYLTPTLKALPSMYTNISMITTGSRTALNTVTGFRAVCLKLRRSMIRASVLIVRSPPVFAAPGQGEEDVIEIRRVHGELFGIDRVVSEPAQQGLQRLHAAVAGNPQGQVLVIPRGAGQEPRRRVEFGGRW